MLASAAVRAARVPLLLLAVTSLACTGRSCSGGGPELPWVTGKDGRAYRLLDKGQYKAYYDAAGALQKIEYDSTGNGHPEQIDYHDGLPRPKRSEFDTNKDGKIDRWEEYDAAGRLVKLATSRVGDRPDKWITFDQNGLPTRIEYDTNGNGRVDRTELLEAGQIVRVEIDADGDGRVDRWQTWQAGKLVSEDLDTDHDGKPDRRLRYGPHGEVLALELLNRN
jgi:EF hand domain-containing protein